MINPDLNPWSDAELRRRRDDGSRRSTATTIERNPMIIIPLIAMIGKWLKGRKRDRGDAVSPRRG